MEQSWRHLGKPSSAGLGNVKLRGTVCWVWTITFKQHPKGTVKVVYNQSLYSSCIYWSTVKTVWKIRGTCLDSTSAHTDGNQQHDSQIHTPATHASQMWSKVKWCPSVKVDHVFLGRRCALTKDLSITSKINCAPMSTLVFWFHTLFYIKNAPVSPPPFK